MKPIRGRRRFAGELIGWFEAHGRDLPWRRTRDPYAILVSEIMLQQTQVATVIPYYHRWLARFPNLTALAAASEKEVLSEWEGLGYYSRARNLQRTAQLIITEHRGIFPAAPALLATLPGVGRYTAGAVATFAFDVRTPILDTNIRRTLARLLNMWMPVDGTTGAARLWDEAERLLPRQHARLFNSALMELGALVCIPRRPRCSVCPVQRFCRATAPGLLPIKKAAAQTSELVENCAFFQKSDRVLLRVERGNRWRGLWKLPPLPAALGKRAPLLELTYPFTHHRITLRIFTAAMPTPMADCSWFSRDELPRTPMPAPHRRALRQLLALQDDKTFAAPALDP